MRTAYLAARLKKVLVRWERAAVAVALALAVAALVGWATEQPLLTGVLGNWPPMRPWTAVLIGVLGIAILAQSGHPSRARVWVGRSLAAASGLVSALFLIEYATGVSAGLDNTWFSGALRDLSGQDLGRLPPVAALPLALLSVAIALTWVSSRWVAVIWLGCLTVSFALVAYAIGQYLFGSLSHLDFVPAHGNAISAALAMALLIVAELLTRPDREPVAALISRPDRALLVQLAGIMSALPVLTAVIHSATSVRGLAEETAWIGAVLISTAMCSAAIFYVTDQDRRERHSGDAQFRSIITNAPNAIAVHNIRHGYEFANASYCGLVGRTDPRELVGRSPEEVVSADSELVGRIRDAERAAKRGEASKFEQEFVIGDNILTVEIQMFPVDDGGGSEASVATIGTDVTERKQAERNLQERLDFEEHISRAVVEGRLLVFAQPIVDALTGQVVEEELLVRMAGPDGELISPDLFLPQALRFGMMPTIDRFMVARAIELARAGRRVAVNLSADSINDSATLGAIVDDLRQAGNVAGRVSFEITESAALASAETAERFSNTMKQLGCQLALDDFGTGFGAFTELRGIALHSLKIDHSFVRDVLKSVRDESVVKMIVGIAREFGLVTTAEGVEDEETRSRLVELGVDQLQGYLIGKPAPASRPIAPDPLAVADV